MFACLHAPGNAALLVECAGFFSPLIEETSQDTVVFDIRGLRRICGTPEQIALEIQRKTGIEANLALASNPDAAVHAAKGIRGVTIIAPGREAAALSSLPPCLLGGTSEFARTLTLWGIRTFGEFAGLPSAGVAARLGQEGTYRQQLARGAVRRSLHLRTEPLVFRKEEEPDEPLDLLEPLMFLLAQMLDELCRQLCFHARSTNEIRLLLKLERASDYTAILRFPVPVVDAKLFLKLLQLELNDKPPGAAVEKIQIEMMPTEPRTAQHGLFVPVAPEPEKLELTLARIRSLVGAENAGSPELMNTHRPDAFRMGALKTSNEAVAPAYVKLTLRRFRPPYPAKVWCTEQGTPSRVLSNAGGGNIMACAGPWRTSGDFWNRDAWHRWEWDVEIQELGVFRVLQDFLQKKWFLEGNYD